MKLSRKDRELMRLALMDSMVNQSVDYSEHERNHMTKLYHRLRKKDQHSDFVNKRRIT